MTIPNRKFPRLFIDLASEPERSTERIPLAGLQRYRKVTSGPNGRYVDYRADDNGAYVWDRNRLAYVLATDY